MYKTATFFIFTLAFLSSLVSYSQDQIKTIEIGDIAPLQQHKMRTVGDDSVSLEMINDENGYLVIFSCNTCPYVIGGKTFEGWEKDYSKINRMAADANVNIVLVNSNTAKREEGDGFEDMVERAKEKFLGTVYLYDHLNILADAFGAKTTPHVFLFNHNHELVYVGSIDNTWNPQEKTKEYYLQDALEAVKNRKPIKVKSTKPIGCSIKRK